MGYESPKDADSTGPSSIEARAPVTVAAQLPRTQADIESETPLLDVEGRSLLTAPDAS